MSARIFALAAAAWALMSGPAQAQMPSPLPAEALADSPDPAKVAFLQRNIVAEGPVIGPFAFRFPRSFLRAKLILVGESHGSAAPHAFDLALLTHLNARVGMRNYLLEADPLQAARLNAYLDSGNDAELDAVFAYWRDSFAQWGSRDYRAKIMAIRALNQRLPDQRRIRFHGIDAVQDWYALGKHLSGQGYTIDTAAIAAAASGTQKARLVLAAISQGGHPSNPLADDLRAALEAQAAGANREEVIFRSYERLVRTGALGEEAAYGLWGVFHVLQQPLKVSTEPFASRVRRSNLPAARSVQSIVLHALDSAVQIPAPLPGGTKRLRMTAFNSDGPFVKVRGSATLRAASRDRTLRVFAISGPGSPFDAGQDFIAIRTSLGQNFDPVDAETPAGGYAQYVGVYRGSDWAVPLEPVQ